MDSTLQPRPGPGAAAWLGVLEITGLVLLAPAIWNGYPLFNYDSGDYIDSAFTHIPKVWRTLPYGLFLELAQVRLGPWVPVMVQALVVAYLLWELVLTLAPRHPLRIMTASVLLLSLGSALPWLASQVMPDVFTGPMVLGIALLAFAPLPWHRRLLITLISVIAICAHASHAGTALALLLTLLLLARLPHGARPRLLLPGVAVLMGVIATPLAHRVYTGEWYLSHAAPIMALARMIQDGQAQPYLRQVCPQAGYSLCPYVGELRSGERGADDFLWGQGSALYKVKGWERWRSFAPEARQIVLGSLWTHPLDNLGAALGSWLHQLRTFGTGSGLEPHLWEATSVELQYFPGQVSCYLTARQYRGIDLSTLSRVHQGLLSLFMLLGLGLTLWGLRRGDPLDRILLLLVVATLVNAAITGVISTPDDRYQARLVWLFVPVVLLALERRRRSALWP
jgi:hypothetical protein